MKVKDLIRQGVVDSVKAWCKQNNIMVQEDDIQVGYPKREGLTDYTTNVALRIASKNKLNPREVATEISKGINISEELCDNLEVAGAGFININLTSVGASKMLQEIIVEDESFGSVDYGNSRKVLLEFVSANPTGPLTIAHARQAAVGDSLVRVFRKLNYNADSEYYLNDRGHQIDLLGESVKVRYLQLLGMSSEIPEGGYKGDYIIDIAKLLKDKHAETIKTCDIDFFRNFAKDHILDMIKKDLKDFGIKFDSWISETKLVKENKVQNITDVLRIKKLLYKKDGALWFKSSKFGDDKDRVIIKNNGDLTYLAPDIAYHNCKYERNYEDLIDIWGPDHHGYIPRIKASVQALGHAQGSLNVLIVQLTTLYRKGKPVNMSTRAGEFVSLRDLLDEIGVDASRYFLASRKPDTHLDFDLEVAKSKSMDNPVYYVQYAHARIMSVFRKFEEQTNENIECVDWMDIDMDILNKPDEKSIIKYLYKFPEVLIDVVKNVSPHFICDYLVRLVSTFHSYYEKHRILNEDKNIMYSRLCLLKGIEIVLKNGLMLIGVSSPERM